MKILGSYCRDGECYASYVVSNTAQLRYTATPSFTVATSYERACLCVCSLRALWDYMRACALVYRLRITRGLCITPRYPYRSSSISNRGLRLFSERMTLPSSHSMHSAHSPHLPHRASLGIISLARLPFVPYLTHCLIPYYILIHFFRLWFRAKYNWFFVIFFLFVFAY